MASRVQTLKDQIIQQEEAKKQANLSKEKAFEECKRIEIEMTDFHNNKDGKLDEMMVNYKHLLYIYIYFTYIIYITASC